MRRHTRTRRVPSVPRMAEPLCNKLLVSSQIEMLCVSVVHAVLRLLTGDLVMLRRVCWGPLSRALGNGPQRAATDFFTGDGDDYINGISLSCRSKRTIHSGHACAFNTQQTSDQQTYLPQSQSLFSNDKTPNLGRRTISYARPSSILPHLANHLYAHINSRSGTMLNPVDRLFLHVGPRRSPGKCRRLCSCHPINRQLCSTLRLYTMAKVRASGSDCALADL